MKPESKRSCARGSLELSQTKAEVLQKHTRDKTIKALEVDVDRKHSEELAKQVTWKLEKTKEAKLGASDRLVHPRGPGQRPGRLRQ